MGKGAPKRVESATSNGINITYKKDRLPGLVYFSPQTSLERKGVDNKPLLVT